MCIVMSFSRLAKLAEEFYCCVDMSEVAEGCRMNEAVVEPIFNYWVLKRKVMII